MSNQSTTNKNALWGWAIGAGVLAFIILKFMMSYAFWPALFLAILIALLVALLIWLGFYRDQDTGNGSMGSSGHADGSASQSGSASAGAASTAAPAASTTSASAPAAPEAPKPATPAQEPAPKPAAKPAASSQPPKGAQDMMGKAGKSLREGESTSSGAAASGTKPAGLSAAREGGADDLKKIKGVGPKLEALLNSMGYFHYDQIADWKSADVAWVDDNLAGFKGRVSRDNWVDQARTLAEGGETAFSKKVDKGGVY